MASLPFKTVVADEGSGRFFAAGASEIAVLKSVADLDAFIARRTPAVPPVSGPPPANASPTPMPGFIGPQPKFSPAPLPDTLLKLDFDKYEAIAFFDGAPEVSSSSRIISVVDQGGNRVVSTERWNPPPNPDAIADVNGRLHVIAIAKSDLPLVTPPPIVADGSAGPGGGGYGVGGNPTMHPTWPAVPNPEITRDMVEKIARAGQDGATITSFDLELKPVSSTLFDGHNETNFTPDSLVWVATLQGHLNLPGPGGGFFAPGVIGGGQPYSTEITELISPEDGMVISSAAKTPSPPPTMQALLKAPDMMHMGETVTFDVHGAPIPGSMQITAKSNGQTLLDTSVAYADLATFQLKLDPADLPGLQDVPLQDVTIEQSHDGEHMDHVVHLVKDPDVQPEPGVMSGKNLPAPVTDDALQAYARQIATEQWKGQNLQTTIKDATAADISLDTHRGLNIPSDVPLKLIEVRGTFPKFFLSELTSGTGKPEVIQPSVVRVVLTDSTSAAVITERGYEN